MLVAYLGFVLILQASFTAAQGNQAFELPGGGKIFFLTSSQDSEPKPEHKHRERYPDGIRVIQLGGDNEDNHDRDRNSNLADGIRVIQLGSDNGHNHDRDRNSNLPDEIRDYLKRQNITTDQGSSSIQVIQLGGDSGPKRRHSHDDEDDDNDDDDVSLRKIFKIFRFGARRGDRRSNVHFLTPQGRDLGNRRNLAQDRIDYNRPVAGSRADVPRTRVQVIRQNVPRRMLVRNLRSSQAHLTNMQSLSFPVFEDEWQMA